jgi:hypothetical protein
VNSIWVRGQNYLASQGALTQTPVVSVNVNGQLTAAMVQGTNNVVQMADGAGIAGRCMQYDANLNTTPAAAPCGTGSGNIPAASDLTGSNGTAFTGVHVYTGLSLNAGNLAVQFGTTAGTATQGNDSRVVGAEQTVNKGAASGYAPLDTNALVPIANVPTGTTSATVAIGNDSRIVGAEQTANKGVVGGYAPLDSSALVPIGNIPVGTTSATVAAGNDSRITGAEQTANKGAVSGYAPLDSSALVPIANLPTGTSGTTVAAGNDSRITGALQSSTAAATYAQLAGAAFNGTVTVPTPSGSDNSTKAANTNWVLSQGFSTVAGQHYIGTWNASTNTPTLTSGTAPTGGAGGYYIVSVAGTTTLDGNSSWPLGSEALFSGSSSTWTFVPAIAPVTQVAGKTGAVSLVVTDITGAAPSASPVFTGTVTVPTPATADSSTAAASTAYVQAQGYITSAGVNNTTVRAALGFTPLNPSNNLSELTATAATARTNLGVAYGTIAGTVAQGNDSRIVGAEQTSHKGVASGYAPLNASSQVPVANLPVGTTSTTVAAGNDSRIVGAQQTSQKGIASGYAPLDTSALVPIANVPVGTTGSTVAAGNDSRITGAEQTANKGAPSGYAPLNSSSQVPIGNIPTGTTSATVAIGNDSRITGAEQTSNKGAPSGYAGLNSAQQVAVANLPVGTAAGTVAAGNDSRISGAEQTSHKGAASGYAPLNASSQVPIGNIPVGTTSTTVAAGNDTRIANAEQVGNKGVASGYAPLNGSAKVPATNLDVAAITTPGVVQVPTTGLIVDSSGNVQVSNQVLFAMIDTALRSLATSPTNPGEYWNNGGAPARVPGTFVPANATSQAQIFLQTVFTALPTTPGAAGTYWMNGGLPTKVPGTLASPATTTQDASTALLNLAQTTGGSASEWNNGGGISIRNTPGVIAPPVATTASTGVVAVPATSQLAVDTFGNIGVNNQILFTMIDTAVRYLPTTVPNVGEYWVDGGKLARRPGAFVLAAASSQAQIFLVGTFGALPNAPGGAGTWWNNGGFPTRVPGNLVTYVSATQDVSTALTNLPFSPGRSGTEWVDGGRYVIVN